MPSFVKQCARKLILPFLILSTLMLGASAADANNPDRFSDDIPSLNQRIAQLTPPAEADVLYVEDEETLVFDIEGRAVRTRYVLYKVLTQGGADRWADVALGWDPWREDRPTLRARVITPDNAIHPLDEKTITDAPAKENQENIFSDRRVMRAPLPAVAPGSIVEEEQVSRERAPFFGAGVVERRYFGASVPVAHTRLELDAPESLPLKYEARLLPDLKPQRTSSNGRVRVVFDQGLLVPVEDIDPWMPSEVPAFPSVTFSTGNSWKQISDEYGKIIDKQIANSDVSASVARLVLGKKSREEKATAILQYLDKEVRYTGVEFADATVVPYPPKETLAKKYGDCKDKAALLVAMLRAAQIPAYMALLDAAHRDEISAELPGMGMFDHAIVYLPGPPAIWIDATDEYARLGEIPSADQGRLALIIRPNSDSLVQTPVSSSVDNLLEEQREIYLAENGPARIIETSQPHGSTESEYRRSYEDELNKSAKDELSNYVKAQYLAEKLDRVERSDPHDLSKQFQLVLESDHARRGITDINLAVAAIRFEGLFSRLPGGLRQSDSNAANKESNQKNKKQRTADYQLPEAFVTEWNYKVVPPAGFQPRPLPKDVEIKLGPAVLTERFTSDADRTVRAVFRFDTVKRRITAAEGEEMRGKIVQIMQGEPVLLYFEPTGMALLNEGKAREGTKAFRDLIALHPKEAIHHVQVSQVMLEAGLGEVARSEARTAVNLEPNSALAQKKLGEVLEYDLVGRKFRHGSDYAGAEAAFRTAERLDPDDREVAVTLAVLLEYNPWGLRYGPGSKLKEAIAEYRKLTPEKRAELGFQNNLAFALFYDGQFAEAEKEAALLNPPPVALLVACEAAMNGTKAALEEARKRTSGDQQFKEVAENAGGMLLKLRKYQVSADLQEAGASGDRASETASYAALYRKIQPHEEMSFGDDPIGVALRFMLLDFRPDLTIEQLRSISSRNGAALLATSRALDKTVKEINHQLSARAREGTPIDISMDLSLTRAQPKVQGSDVTGYKVTLWPSAPYKRSTYIVKEDGRYKVLGTSGQAGAVGLEVLDRIATNDLPGARQLLDWVREDVHRQGDDDPLTGAPFPRIWTKGKDADVATMKLAAATLVASFRATAAMAVPILESLRQSANGDDRFNALHASIVAYDLTEQYEKALATAEALAALYPESKRVFNDRTRYLRYLGRYDEADRLVEERSKAYPDELETMRASAFDAAYKGDYRRAHEIGVKFLETGKASDEDYNGIAWHALFTNHVEQADIDYALKAVQLNKNSALLHTLGCLYAATGKTKEARDVLVQSMDSLNLDEPDGDYWYAFGLIAEDYGENDAAKADYTRANAPERAADEPESSHRLAQMRLQELRGVKR